MSSAKIGRYALVIHQIERLRDAVFLKREVGRLEPADELAFLVVHARFQQDAGHFRRFRYLERLEHDRCAPFPSQRVVYLYGELAAIERVGVEPLHGIRRPVGDRAQERAVDIEANGVNRRRQSAARSARRCGPCRRRRCGRAET